jgi:hypothetical protein
MTDARGDGPSRRSVLAGGGVLLLAACTGSSTPRAPELTADQRLARRVADEINVLATAYAVTIAAHPNSRASLAALAAEHVAHAVALVALLPKPTSTPTFTSSSSPPPNGSASPSASPPLTVAPTVAAALAELAAAERAAAARRRHQADRAGPELARLLASIAACESVHATLVAR